MKIKKKKAMGIEDAGMVIYRLIFLVIAIAVFIMFTNMLLKPPTNINNAKAEILLGRVLYSEAIHYREPTTNRVYTNIVDVDKLLEMNGTDPLNPRDDIKSRLEEYFEEEFYNPARSNLLVSKLNINMLNPQMFREQNILNFESSKRQYMLLNPKKTFSGKGAVSGLERTFRTNCKYNDYVLPCELNLELLIPNS